MSSNYRFVSCYDEPNRLLEINVNILERFRPRLYCHIMHDEPSIDNVGRPFWRTDMRLAVFATLYQSLKKMRLVLAEGASLAEVQAVFEYEGIIMSNQILVEFKNTSLRLRSKRQLRYSTGHGFRKRLFLQNGKWAHNVRLRQQRVRGLRWNRNLALIDAMEIELSQLPSGLPSGFRKFLWI